MAGLNNKIQEIQNKIENITEKINKRVEVLRKIDVKLSQTTDEYQRRHLKSDKESGIKKLEKMEQTLYKYVAQKKKLERTNIEVIPVIDEFLNTWKEKAKKEFIKEMEDFENLRDSRNQYSEEEYKKELEKFDKVTFYLMNMHPSWRIEELEKLLEEEKFKKLIDLTKRVNKICGKITNADDLLIGNRGDINGIIIGEKGKAEVRTIEAGGYNIQCFHFRVLIREWLQE
ncbi:hypothetical protein [uncultured Fusobacterium sp.]|uniref:hypothetical protein n=1 Tax=uncultured Fusobacterium sp. TaxID=159267 RepID=UPI0015A66708|nr:hypothetical protein [uncultured Fusobacterium sp.]